MHISEHILCFSSRFQFVEGCHDVQCLRILNHLGPFHDCLDKSLHHFGLVRQKVASNHEEVSDNLIGILRRNDQMSVVNVVGRLRICSVIDVRSPADPSCDVLVLLECFQSLITIVNPSNPDIVSGQTILSQIPKQHKTEWRVARSNDDSAF